MKLQAQRATVQNSDGRRIWHDTTCWLSAASRYKGRSSPASASGRAVDSGQRQCASRPLCCCIPASNRPSPVSLKLEGPLAAVENVAGGSLWPHPLDPCKPCPVELGRDQDQRVMPPPRRPESKRMTSPPSCSRTITYRHLTQSLMSQQSAEDHCSVSRLSSQHVAQQSPQPTQRQRVGGPVGGGHRLVDGLNGAMAGNGGDSLKP